MKMEPQPTDFVTTKGLPTLNHVLSYLSSVPLGEVTERPPLEIVTGVVRILGQDPRLQENGIRVCVEFVYPEDSTWDIAASTSPDAPVSVRNPISKGLTGWAVRTARTPALHVSRRDQMPEMVQFLEGYEHVQSAFLWVLRNAQRPVATICAVSDKPNAISTDLADCLLRIGWLFKALTIDVTENAGIRTRHAEAFLLSDDAPVSEILDRLFRTHPADHAFFWEWKPLEGVLQPHQVPRPNRVVMPDDWPGRLRLGEGFAGTAAANLEPVIEPHVRDGVGQISRIATRFPDIRPGVPFRSVLAQPVVRDGAFYGVVEVFSETDGHFSQSSERDLLPVASALASYYHKQKARELSSVVHQAVSELWQSLSKPETPTEYWRSLSKVLSRLESNEIVSACALYIGRLKCPNLYTCKSCSRNASHQMENPAQSIDCANNTFFRRVLMEKASDAIHTLEADLLRPPLKPLLPSRGMQYYARSYNFDPPRREYPTILVVAPMPTRTAWTGRWRGQALEPVLSQVFSAVFATTRHILTTADMERLGRQRLETLAATTHELRSPLNTIRLSAEELSGKVAENKPALEIVNRIISKVGRMSVQVDNILYQWMVSQGQRHGKSRAAEAEVSELDPCELVQRLIVEARTVYPLTRFVEDVPQRLDRGKSERGRLLVRANEFRLRLAIRNLLDNAVKFGLDSPVTLRLRVAEIDGIEKLKLEICDKGIGIPQENYKSIFQAGEKHAYSRRRVVRGAAVGLSITKAIIEDCDGNIWPQSAVGKETTMIVTLPIVWRK